LGHGRILLIPETALTLNACGCFHLKPDALAGPAYSAWIPSLSLGVAGLRREKSASRLIA